MNKAYIFLRVSREDLDETSQLIEILKFFKLKESECIVIRETISAYKDDVQDKRSEFIRLKELIEQGEVNDLYVYSLERLERNIIRLFEIFFFAEANGCRIHGALQPALELDFEDSPMGTFSRYQQVLLWGLLAENESYMISKRTKKTVVQKKNAITKSTYGKKWGKSLTYPDKSKVSMSTQRSLNENITTMAHLYEKGGVFMYYSLVIKRIYQKYGIIISKSYITKLKHNNNG